MDSVLQTGQAAVAAAASAVYSTYHCVCSDQHPQDLSSRKALAAVCTNPPARGKPATIECTTVEQSDEVL